MYRKARVYTRHTRHTWYARDKVRGTRCKAHTRGTRWEAHEGHKVQVNAWVG